MGSEREEVDEKEKKEIEEININNFCGEPETEDLEVRAHPRQGFNVNTRGIYVGLLVVMTRILKLH